MTSKPVELDWYGCDLRTGRIVEDLPALRPTGVLSRRLGAHTSTSFELALGGAPADWEAATAPGRSLLVAVDRATDTPVWPGIVLTRGGGSAQTVSLGAATPEAYLERRYTGDVTIVQQDQADAAAAAATPALTQGPPFVLDTTATGTLMDWIVLDGDDRTALSALQELMGLDGGPEFTVDVAWKGDRSGFDLPLRIAPRIGSQAVSPEGTFDFPGCITSYALAESYEAGKGATVTQARGEGEGTSRLTSVPQVADQLEALGWPRHVYRFTPATGVTDPDQLTRHAAQALALMGTGAQVWTVDAVASAAPRIGRDWALGHTVRISVTASPRHPNGVDVVARAWSWELDPGADRVRPILVQED